MLVAQQYVQPTPVFFLEAANLRAVFRLLGQGHGIVVVIGVAVLRKAQGVEAQGQRSLDHRLGGVAAVGEGGVAVDVGAREISVVNHINIISAGGAECQQKKPPKGRR